MIATQNPHQRTNPKHLREARSAAARRSSLSPSIAGRSGGGEADLLLFTRDSQRQRGSIAGFALHAAFYALLLFRADELAQELLAQYFEHASFDISISEDSERTMKASGFDSGNVEMVLCRPAVEDGSMADSRGG